MQTSCTESEAHTVTRLLKKHFGPQMEAAVVGTQFKPWHLCAICCRETGGIWVRWLKADPRLSIETIMARCVMDEGGDNPGKPRNPYAFPANTKVFRERFDATDPDFSRMLICEANETLKLWKRDKFVPTSWIFKGYGLFQYDLQHVLSDARSKAFFRERRWYRFDECLHFLMTELREKSKLYPDDVWMAIRAYNSDSEKANPYMQDVKAMTQWCRAAWQADDGG